MLSTNPPPAPDYRSPPWIQALGHLIERGGLWTAVVLCTLLCQVLSVLSILLISLVVMPESPGKALLIGVLVPLMIAPTLSFAVFRLIEDLSRARGALHQIASFDSLTRAHSRAFFMTAMTVPCPISPVHSEPDGIVLLDIDDFKQVNDRHGHLVGDAVLQAVSDACRRQLRRDDLFARFGGEEFVILLANVGPDLARTVAERIRRAIADLEIRHPSGARISVTASLGIAHRDDRLRGAGQSLLEQALGLADQALYLAKRNGKNRAEFVSFGGQRPLSVAARLE
jgi:diguanylate cyclase (GGDEF)-like protein